MSAYLIAEIHQTGDPEELARYRELATEAVARFGGQYLVRGGAYEIQEGTWDPERVVVIEFPDRTSAVAFYHSPEYAEAAKIRQANTDRKRGGVLIVDGV